MLLCLNVSVIFILVLHYLAILQNLSQQTDVTDLLGGYKPTDAQSICMPLYHEFKELFCMTFSKKVHTIFMCFIVIDANFKDFHIKVCLSYK